MSVQARCGSVIGIALFRPMPWVGTRPYSKTGASFGEAEGGFFRDHAVFSRRRKEGATMQLTVALNALLTGLAVSAAALVGPAWAQPLDKVTFGSNWVA
jgi:hypothetical protein